MANNNEPQEKQNKPVAAPRSVRPISFTVEHAAAFVKNVVARSYGKEVTVRRHENGNVIMNMGSLEVVNASPQAMIKVATGLRLAQVAIKAKISWKLENLEPRRVAKDVEISRLADFRKVQTRLNLLSQQSRDAVATFEGKEFLRASIGALAEEGELLYESLPAQYEEARQALEEARAEVGSETDKRSNAQYDRALAAFVGVCATIARVGIAKENFLEQVAVYLYRIRVIPAPRVEFLANFIPDFYSLSQAAAKKKEKKQQQTKKESKQPAQNAQPAQSQPAESKEETQPVAQQEQPEETAGIIATDPAVIAEIASIFCLDVTGGDAYAPEQPAEAPQETQPEEAQPETQPEAQPAEGQPEQEQPADVQPEAETQTDDNVVSF